jgi:hypothetical protein
MERLLTRISAALLCGFGVFVIALPVACCGLVAYNGHVTGDVESNGPQAILGAMGVAAVLGLMVVLLVMVKSRRQ